MFYRFVTAPFFLLLAASLTWLGCRIAGKGTDSIDHPAASTRRDTLRPDWHTAFAAENAVGTFVLYHPHTGLTERYNAPRAAERFCPASTFKIYNSLVALEAGVVQDVDSLFIWDGQQRSVAAWNKDHSLRSGMKYSVVWLYQLLARLIGREQYEGAFAKTPYGNRKIGEQIDLFWLDGSLRISADEQVLFIDKLRRGELGFADTLQSIVRDIMPVVDEWTEGGAAYRIKAKTGMGTPDGEPQIGWMVGWVETPLDTGVFAMNSEQAVGQTYDMLGGRLRIVRGILKRSN